MFTFLYYLIIILTIYLAIAVITVENPITALLCLISCFISISFLLFLLEFTFFAIIFIAIYIGAIAIFFLFVVMFINIPYDFQKYHLLRDLIIINLVFITIYQLLSYFSISHISLIQNNQIISNISLLILYTQSLQILSLFLYTYGKFFVIYASLVLYIAMIGSILLLTDLAE